MPELVDDVLELLAPWPSANALAREVGFDSATSAATAAQLAVPLIVAGMVHRLNDPDDSAALIQIVRDVDTSGLDDFGATLTDRAYEPTGTKVIQRIFGDHHKTVAVRLAPEAECTEDSAINVFPAMAWAVTGLIVKRNGREHNRHSLLQIIRNEHDGLLRTGWGEWMSAVAPETSVEADQSSTPAPEYAEADAELVDAQVAAQDGVSTLDVPANPGPSRYPPPMPRTSRSGDLLPDADLAVAQADTRIDVPTEFTTTAQLTPTRLPGTESADGSIGSTQEDTLHLDEESHADLAAELRRTADVDVEVGDRLGGSSDESSDHKAFGDDPVDPVPDFEVDREDADGDLDAEAAPVLDAPLDQAVKTLDTDPADGVMAGGEQAQSSPEGAEDQGLLEHLEQAIAELEAEDSYNPEGTGTFDTEPVADIDAAVPDAPVLENPVADAPAVDNPVQDSEIQDAVVVFEEERGETQSMLPAPRPDTSVVRRESPDLQSLDSLPPLAPGSELSAYLPPGASLPEDVAAPPRAESTTGMGLTDFSAEHPPGPGTDPIRVRSLGSAKSSWTAIAIGLLLLVVAMGWFLAEDQIAPVAEVDPAVETADASFDLVLEGTGSEAAQATVTFDSVAEEFCYEVSSTGLGSAPALEFGQGQVGSGAPIVNAELAGAEAAACVPMTADVIASVLADPAGHYLTVADADLSVGSQLSQ